MNERNETLDVCKGIGILCVIIGHLVYWGTPLSKFVFGFHMPLFFFISGIFFRPDRDKSFADQIKRLWLKLGAPFFVFTVLALPVYLFRSDISISSMSGIRVFAVSLFHGRPIVNTPLWFLTVSALVQIVFRFFIVGVKFPTGGIFKSLFVICLFVFALCLSKASYWVKTHCPAMVIAVPGALVYYSLGWFLKEKVEEVLKMFAKKSIFPIIAVLIAAMFLIVAYFSSESCLDMPDMHWQFAITSVLGILTVLSFGCLLADCLLGRFLSFIGRNSLCYFGLEKILLAFWIFILSSVGFAVKWYPLSSRTKGVNSEILFVLQLVSLSVLVFVYKKISFSLTNLKKEKEIK